MSNTTVAQFAAELNRPVDDLLKQLKEAGVNKSSGSDSLTLDDKQLLNAYLKKKNGNDGGTISIRRKKTEVSTVDGVKVETRRRSRAVTIPSSEELAAEAKAKVAAENQKAEAEKQIAKADNAKAEAKTAEGGKKVILQMGSYADRNSADAQRAKLAMLGISSKVVERTNGDKTVYRVQSNSMSSEAAKNVQKDLQKHNINSLMRSAQ